jgi:hypothetical protein
MKFANDFESFLRTEVNLNQGRLDKLQQKVDAIESFLAGHETFREAFIDLIPAGSWAHRMIIKPVMDNDEFDADVLFYIEEQPRWLPKDYVEELYKAFRSSGIYKELAERKKRCVRIDYAGDVHVDVVPYLERSGQHYITYRLEPKGEGRFELSNPEGFTEWVDERQRITDGTFIKVVRLLKYLRDFKNTFTCVSIILTTLLGNEVNEIEASFNPKLYADVPSTLVTLLEKLAASLPPTMPAVMDPAGTGDNFSDRYKDDWNYENFRSRIINYAEKARQAFDENDDREKAIALWRDIFGDKFKPGALASVASLAPLSASVAWSEEQFIDRPPFNYPIKLSPQWKVRISGRCTGLRVGQVYRRKGFRQFDLATNGNRVPKNRSLRFSATTNVPKPYRLYWKVRNGGQEAADASQLRGEITKDTGSNIKTEPTAYKGTHYVDCYVVKDGVVVASDRQMVIIGS